MKYSSCWDIFNLINLHQKLFLQRRLTKYNIVLKNTNIIPTTTVEIQ